MFLYSVLLKSSIFWFLNNMVAEYAPVSREDTAKIMSLVQEYADKLRALCLAYSDARARRQQLFLMSATFLSVIITSSLFFAKLIAPSAILDSSSFGFVVAMGAAIACAAPFLWLGPLTRSRDLYDVHQMAMTVERLLRTASQYSEHSTHALGDKFEFDIRLAEAEAALHVYRNVFGEKSEWKNSKFSLKIQDL